MSKKCSMCKEFKDEVNYHKNGKTKSGYDNLCKPCRTIANRNYKQRKKVIKLQPEQGLIINNE